MKAGHPTIHFHTRIIASISIKPPKESKQLKTKTEIKSNWNHRFVAGLEMWLANPEKDKNCSRVCTASFLPHSHHHFFCLERTKWTKYKEQHNDTEAVFCQFLQSRTNDVLQKENTSASMSANLCLKMQFLWVSEMVGALCSLSISLSTLHGAIQDFLSPFIRLALFAFFLCEQKWLALHCTQAFTSVGTISVLFWLQRRQSRNWTHVFQEFGGRSFLCDL